MELLFDTSPWLTGVILVVYLCAAAEVGFRVGILRAKKTPASARESLSIVQGAMLALLGLLLGFTFAMAGTRYDTRKALVVREANAIGTAALRAELLPEPHRSEVRALLLTYVSRRLAASTGPITEAAFTLLLAESSRIQKALWAHAVTVAVDDKRGAINALFVASINDVIDLHTDRIAVLRDRVPEVILWLLFGFSTLSMGMLGYSHGLGGRRNVLPATIFAILVTSVVLVILDLDRPRHGFIQVSQQALIDVQEQLKQP